MEIISGIVIFLQILLLLKVWKLKKELGKLKLQMKEQEKSLPETKVKKQEKNCEIEKLPVAQDKKERKTILDTVEKEKLLDAVLSEVFT